MSAEELYIKNIESGIRSIKLKNTPPKDTLAPASLIRLKTVNIGMYESYIEKYKTAVAEYKKKNNETE